MAFSSGLRGAKGSGAGAPRRGQPSGPGRGPPRPQTLVLQPGAVREVGIGGGPPSPVGRGGFGGARGLSVAPRPLTTSNSSSLQPQPTTPPQRIVVAPRLLTPPQAAPAPRPAEKLAQQPQYMQGSPNPPGFGDRGPPPGGTAPRRGGESGSLQAAHSSRPMGQGAPQPPPYNPQPPVTQADFDPRGRAPTRASEPGEPHQPQPGPASMSMQPPEAIKDNAGLAHLIGLVLHHRAKAIEYLKLTQSEQSGEYRVWASGLLHVDNLQLLENEPPERQSMQLLDLDLRHVAEGILTLVPRTRDLYLPLFDPIPSNPPMRGFKLVVMSTTSLDTDRATLFEGVIREPTASEKNSLPEGELYNVELLYSLSSGVIVYFNARDYSLGRIEFHMGDDSNGLPVWYLRYLYHQGLTTEADKLSDHRLQLLNIGSCTYAELPRIARHAPIGDEVQRSSAVRDDSSSAGAATWMNVSKCNIQ